MKYLDEKNVEIPEQDIDYNKGVGVLETKIIAHHDAVNAVEEVSHFEVSTFYFEDDTSMEITSQEDPHVEIIDLDKGIFNYVDQGEGKTLRGIDLKTVVDIPAQEAQDASDEVEEFIRWHWFTPEELVAKEAEKAEQAARENFIATGESRLTLTESEVVDLAMAIAEIAAVA